MAKYVLNPSYGDMSVVVLGSTVSSIKKKLKKHWEDELEYPEDYDSEQIENIKYILETEYDSVEDLQEDYTELIDEDYHFTEAD